MDAEIDKETGFIISFVVEAQGAYPSFFNKKGETKKIAVQNIAIIGKDVIIVSKSCIRGLFIIDKTAFHCYNK